MNMASTIRSMKCKKKDGKVKGVTSTIRIAKVNTIRVKAEQSQLIKKGRFIDGRL